MSPWMRSWALQEKDRADSGYYRKPKRPHSTMLTVWLVVLIAAVGAIVMDMYKPEPETVQVDRKEVMKWNAETEDVGFWVQRELFVLRTCRNADKIYAQIMEDNRK